MMLSMDAFEVEEDIKKAEREARRAAFDQAIEIIRATPDYSDGDGLRSPDPRCITEQVIALEAARDTEEGKVLDEV